MITYRNERKAEGATPAELRIYDGKIHALLSSSERLKKSRDMELVIYRRQRQSEGAAAADLALIDAAIHAQFSGSPGLIGDIIVRRMPPQENVSVSIDFNNSTVGDLYNSVAAALGVDVGRMRLILRGKHIDNVDASLRIYHLSPGDALSFCMRLGCNGRCCDMFYGSMCDANQRLAAEMFKGHSADDVRRIYALTALSKTIVEREQEEQRQGLQWKKWQRWSQGQQQEQSQEQSQASVKVMSSEALLNWAKTGLNCSTFNTIENCMSEDKPPESPVPSPPSHTPAEEEKQEQLQQSQQSQEKKPIDVEDLYG